MRSSLMESRAAGEQGPAYAPVMPQAEVRQPRDEMARGAQGVHHAPRSGIIRPLGGWLPFVLLAISVYTVVVGFIQAGWVSGSSVLLYSTAAGLLTGLGVAKMRRFPQSILHLAACLAGYWLAVWLASEVALHIPWTALLADLRALISGSVLSSPELGNQAIFLFYLTFLSFFMAYFGAWLIYRARMPWLVALVYCSIMLVNLQVARSDLSMTLVVLLAALLLLIGQMQLSNQLERWMQEGLHTDRAWLRNIRGRFMRITALLTVVIILLCLILPVFEQPQVGVTVWNYIDAAWNNLVSNPGGLYIPGTQSQGTGGANFFGDQLAITGSVNLPTGEVLAYKTSGAGSSQGRYLESVAYDQFDGHTWMSSPPASQMSQQYPSDATLPVEGPSNVTPVTTNITILNPPQGSRAYIFAPAQPRSFTVPVTLYGKGIISAWTQQTKLTAGEQYQVESLVPAVTAQELSAVPLLHSPIDAWASDPNYSLLKNYYLEVPADLSQQAIATAHEWTQGATNVYQAMNMLVEHLSDQQTFTYSIENAPVPGNVDAVTWLLQTHKGFCTYYATAMTVMARVLGVPARVVSGFNEGYFDAKRGAWVVNGQDAHSWVQVYFPNVGWINFDPTPGFSLNPTGLSQPMPTLTVTPTKPGQIVTPTVPRHGTPTADPPSHGTSSGTTSQGMSGPETLFLAFSLAVLAISLLILGMAVIRYRDSKRLAAGTGTIIATTYWRLSRLGAWSGLSPGKAQTPYEYTSLLARRFPQANHALWRLTHLFVRERWGAPQHAPTPGEEQAVKRLWPALRATMLRGMLRRRTSP
jgi:hypothetical protein